MTPALHLFAYIDRESLPLLRPQDPFQRLALNHCIKIPAYGLLLAIPFCGNAQIRSIPGIVQAEHFDLGGEGVGYHDADTGNLGGDYRTAEDVDIQRVEGSQDNYNIAWIDAGEWLRYTVQVENAGYYRMRCRVAAEGNSSHAARLSSNGKTVDVFPFEGTGGWQVWQNVISSRWFLLEAGPQVFQLDFMTTAFNLDEFELIAVDDPVPPYMDASLDLDARVEDLIGRMSLDEKMGQMCQRSVSGFQPLSDLSTYHIGSLLSGGGEAPANNTPRGWADFTDIFQSYALSTPLQIPILYGIDAVHGHNNVIGATIFPHNIGLGATRNPALVREIARITAREVAATGIHWSFAPCVAVARNESWGRTYESFSEEPGLVSSLGVAAIEGLQGDDLTADASVLACAKHFVADGGTEGGIDQGNSIMDEATLRAIHLPPYTAAVDAGVQTVMASFSSWNGQKVHGHKDLLTGLLKEELGFDGFVVSDWKAIDQIDSNYRQAIIKSVNAGIDMVMLPLNYKDFLNKLRASIEAEDISMERIDDAVRRILAVKMRAGLFEKPYAPRHLLPQVGSPAHRAVARRAVAESLVVLKDPGKLLPLSKRLGRIHLAGESIYGLKNQCGGWTISWQGNGEKTIGTTISQAIVDSVSGQTRVTYSPDGRGAAGADVAIVAVGETPYAEGAGDNTELVLTDADLEAIEAVQQAGIPTIVILLSGRPLYIESHLDDWDALIAAWLPGTEGQGVADVLFGDRFPTGILCHTWPKDSGVPVNQGDAGYDPLFAYGFSVHVEGDWDNDGMADRWEALNRLDPLDDGTANPLLGPGADIDSDGASNRFEFQSGTDPRSAASVFKIKDARMLRPAEGSPAFHLTVSTVPGFLYEIQYADELINSSAGWSIFADNTNGTGSWLETAQTESAHTFIDDFGPRTSGGAPVSGKRFYRMAVDKP